MSHIIKKTLAYILLLCMLLTALPLGVFASEDTPPATEPEVSMETGIEIVAEDCVSSSYFLRASIGVVNGHDYLYISTRGGKFIVYDVDEMKQITSIKLDNDTPRHMLVDENGIVWSSHAKGFLRYDPFTNTSEVITLDFSETNKATVGALGQVSDGMGKIYYGTLQNGFIGYYDTATKKSHTISGLLGLEPNNVGDAKFSGYGGLIYKDGYLYLGIDGDMNADGNELHAFIKYDIENQKIVDWLDLKPYFVERKYVDYVKLVDNILFCSYIGGGTIPPIDISGDKMKFVQLDGFSTNAAAVTEELDGKVYFCGYAGEDKVKGVLEYDLATQSAKLRLAGNYTFRLMGNHFVTIEGDDRLPGQSVLIPINDDSGVINLRFWNPQTNQMVDYEANIGLTGGAGSNLRGLTTDPTGRYIYMGAYGNIGIAKYDTVEGKVVDTFNSYSHQTDALLWYEDYLYAGNYSAGTITKIDPQTYEIQPLFTLRYSVFEQCRMHAMTAGGNKVFCGTVPYSGFGGVLVWYDFDKNLTYVAAGPNPEDVYYADTTGMTVDTDVSKVKFTWYNAVSGEAMDFDDDDDGKDDVYLADGTRRFRGVIQDQILNNIIYSNGYIYGTSAVTGSSGTFPEDTAQAVLFVYDVAAMKVIATCDLADHLEGFTDRIPYLDQLEEDPEEPGKFWGVIDDTLYTMTFDVDSKTFNIKEEFSIKKEQYYSTPGGSYSHRDMCFAGEYLYVGFGRHTGTYMVRKIDTSERHFINEFSPNCMVLAADGNLYWTSNETSKDPKALSCFPVGEKAAPLLAKAPLDTAQRLINALPDKITKGDKAAIEAARKAYDKLTDEQKAQITGLDKLTAAEEAYAKLPSFNITIVYVFIAAAVVLAGAAVAVVMVLKKKKKAE